LDAEGAGKLDAAAGAYAAALALRPDSLDATEGMRRLAQARGDRKLQAAVLLEEEGQDAEAAQLFLKVLERIPADDEAYHRLHAILTRRDDNDGLDRLLGYKIQQTTDPAARVRLYLDRAR